MRVVIDTNIFTGALIRKDGLNRRILELCFMGELQPLMSEALALEYEDVMGRDKILENSAFDPLEQDAFLDDFCSICQWVDIYYQWRPNLRDEGDNFLIELALAGGAGAILTWNVKDLRRGELDFEGLEIARPDQFIKTYRQNQHRKEA